MNEHVNPWKIIDEQEIYDNNWITVTHYNVINPSGNKGIYGKVHMKNAAIGIVPLDEEMNTYLVGQYRFVLNEYTWEIPEGGGPLSDEPLASAQRELLEETGLKAKRWQMIQEMALSNSVTDERCFIFLARELSQHAPAPEETEDLMIRKVSFEEVYNMVREARITDAVTVAAVLKIKLMILEGKL
jgi:8-oxo-dGTP pyrophosphatase MutT (NUDIX family)